MKLPKGVKRRWFVVEWEISTTTGLQTRRYPRRFRDKAKADKLVADLRATADFIDPRVNEVWRF